MCVHAGIRVYIYRYEMLCVRACACVYVRNNLILLYVRFDFESFEFNLGASFFSFIYLPSMSRLTRACVVVRL
jgi:hypothetical protein